MLSKINVKTVLSITGTVLGIAGTIVSTIANQKAMDGKIAEEVAKQMKAN